MRKEDKELLLKDLCARLPYGVKLPIQSWDEREMEFTDRVDILYSINSDGYIKTISEDYDFDLEDVKPYLFPLSNMTDKQKEELFYNYIHNDIYFDDFTDYFLAGEFWHDICVSLDKLPALINWLLKNHFDIYGLIPKKLAIDATGLNIY